jgi:hypothetical protein
MSSIQAYLWNKGSHTKMEKERHKQGKHQQGLGVKLPFTYSIVSRPGAFRSEE